MADLSAYSDEELMQAAKMQNPAADLSDDDLMQIAGIKNLASGPHTNLPLEPTFADFNKDLEDRALFGQRSFEQMQNLGEMSRQHTGAPHTDLPLEEVPEKTLWEVVKGKAGEMGSEALRGLKTQGQVAANLGMGAISYPLGMVAGLGGLVAGEGIKGFQKRQQRLQENLTPAVGELTPEAQAALETVGTITGAPSKGLGAGAAAVFGEGARPYGEVAGDVLLGLLPVVPRVVRGVKASGWYRELTIPQRDLVVQDIAQMQKAGLTEGQILRNSMKRGSTGAYKAAVEKRMPEPAVEPIPALVEAAPIPETTIGRVRGGELAPESPRTGDLPLGQGNIPAPAPALEVAQPVKPAVPSEGMVKPITEYSDAELQQIAAPPKEPWQMTKKEFEENPNKIFMVPENVESLFIRKGKNMGVGATTEAGASIASPAGFIPRSAFESGEVHRAIINQALISGLPVPPEVLTEYPDLAQPPTPKAELSGAEAHWKNLIIDKMAEEGIRDFSQKEISRVFDGTVGQNKLIQKAQDFIDKGVLTFEEVRATYPGNFEVQPESPTPKAQFMAKVKAAKGGGSIEYVPPEQIGIRINRNKKGIEQEVAYNKITGKDLEPIPTTAYRDDLLKRGYGPPPGTPFVGKFKQPTPPASVAGVPFMLTSEMKSGLLAKGLTDEAISKLKPEQAHEILGTGPGAQTAGTKETPSDLSQLTDSLNQVVSPNDPLRVRVKKALDMSEKAGAAKETASGALDRLKSVTASLYSKWKNPPKVTEFKGVLGDYLYTRQVSSLEGRQFTNTIMKQVPSKLRREALVNYVQGGGDDALLAQRAGKSTPQHKAGYEAATKLTTDEKRFADNIGNYFDAKLEEAKKWGMLKQGVTDYVSQLFKKDDPHAKAIVAEIDAGILKEDPFFIKKRIFHDYFEAEQARMIPKNKDIGWILGTYDKAFNEAIAARTFVKSLLDAKASDGKPLAVVSGAGKVIPIEGTTDTAGLVIRPKVLPKDLKGLDYQPLNHPSLKGWKWLTEDPLGDPVLMEGDIVIHPEAFKHIKALLSKSAIRENPVGGAVLKGVQELKSTLLSASGFHQVQEGVHAVFHKVNPFTTPEIDLANPVQKQLVRHGLMISEYDGMEAFAEGLHATGLVNKLPLIGGLSQKYGEYLFSDLIPRLKMKMAQDALERNQKRYSKKLSEDQIYEITANQANAAFGELNYKWIGRSKTVQDVLRLIALAPDFLEARMKFVGQAMKPYGREQSAALIRGALGMYLGAVVVNMVLNDGDPKADKPFSLVIKGKEYALRSIPGDIVHLFSNPNSFVYYRLNPTTVRTLVEFATQRDAQGKKRTTPEQIKDFFTTHVPIPLQGMVKDNDKKLLEGAIQSLGINAWKNRTKAEKMVMDLNFDKISKGFQSPEDRERSKIRQKAMREWEDSKGIHPDLAKAIKEKKIAPLEAAEWLKSAEIPPLQRGFKGLTVEEAMEVWKVATPAERKLILPQFSTKLQNRVKKVEEGRSMRMPVWE